MAKHLNERTAIVTGGARGVGRAIAESLAAEGANVVIVDNGSAINGEAEAPDLAEHAAAEMGGTVVGLAADIADPETSTRAVALARERFGALDIVVNNAAILRDAFVFKGQAGDWDAVLAANLSGAFYLLASATPVLREHAKEGRGGGQWGRIVNIVSTAGLYGNYGQSPYASAKAGLVGLTRVAALDMARSGTTCNAIAPFAATRVTETIKPANEAQESYKKQALSVPAHHVATLVSYLCSDAAAHVSGQVFGARGREVFLFSQPRPVNRIVKTDEDWTIDSLAPAVEQELAGQFTALETDLESFDTEPVI